MQWVQGIAISISSYLRGKKHRLVLGLVYLTISETVSPTPVRLCLSCGFWRYMYCFCNSGNLKYTLKRRYCFAFVVVSGVLAICARNDCKVASVSALPRMPIWLFPYVIVVYSCPLASRAFLGLLDARSWGMVSRGIQESVPNLPGICEKRHRRAVRLFL